MVKILLVLLCFILTVSIIFGFVAFFNTSNEKFNATIIFFEFIPGVSSNEQPGSFYEHLQKDKYGRELVKGQVYFLPTNKVEDIYAIIQKYDDGGVYVYEDNNYFIAEYGNIEDLKALNDWNTPLDETKMSYKKGTYESLQVKKSNQTEIDMTLMLDKFAKKTGISKDEITYELNIDVDVKGNCLNMYVHEGDTREVYAVVCDNNYNIKYVILEVDENYPNQIAKLKKQIGWVY